MYYGWFLQNLRKDFIRTNMHTTVYIVLVQTQEFVVQSFQSPAMLYLISLNDISRRNFTDKARDKIASLNCF